MSDILATHRRLIAEAEGGRFDRRAVQDHLAAANYSVAHAAILVEVLFQRLAQKAGSSS